MHKGPQGTSANIFALYFEDQKNVFLHFLSVRPLTVSFLFLKKCTTSLEEKKNSCITSAIYNWVFQRGSTIMP